MSDINIQPPSGGFKTIVKFIAHKTKPSETINLSDGLIVSVKQKPQMWHRQMIAAGLVPGHSVHRQKRRCKAQNGVAQRHQLAVEKM